MGVIMDLLEELTEFCEKYGLSDTALGLAATGDSHLIHRMRRGGAGTARRSTVLKLRRYMARRALDADI
jgi:hypothetical protein